MDDIDRERERKRIIKGALDAINDVDTIKRNSVLNEPDDLEVELCREYISDFDCVEALLVIDWLTLHIKKLQIQQKKNK